MSKDFDEIKTIKYIFSFEFRTMFYGQDQKYTMLEFVKAIKSGGALGKDEINVYFKDDDITIDDLGFYVINQNRDQFDPKSEIAEAYFVYKTDKQSIFKGQYVKYGPVALKTAGNLSSKELVAVLNMSETELNFNLDAHGSIWMKLARIKAKSK